LAQMIPSLMRQEPVMPAHFMAHLLESDFLDADAVSSLRATIERDGVDPETILTSGAQLPMRWFREAYPSLDAEKAACIGYAAGEHAHLTSYGLLSLSLVSASSINEVIRLLAFMPLISNVIKARIQESKDALLVTLSVNSGDAVLDRIPLFYSAAALMHLLRLISEESPELSIHIAWPMPEALATHREVVSGRLHFDAPMHFIKVPHSTLISVCRFPDPVAYKNIVAILQAKLDEHDLNNDVAGHVRSLLAKVHGRQSIDHVAAVLNLSVSTLKRRLTKCHTSFSELQEEALCDRAKLMLMDASMTLDTISASLGYSDLSNFSHAFKRWTGIAPGKFRRVH